MVLLLLVSFIWAFSFGLIKRLTGLDPVAVSVVRLGLATLVFLPFLRLRRLRAAQAFWFGAIGAVQFGLMYVLYLQAFRFLQAYEVALFTIFTPFYVALTDGALQRRLPWRHLVAAGLAVAGAGVVLWSRGLSSDGMVGFLLMQGSNLCFAMGQIAYKRTRETARNVSDHHLFSWMYVGAFFTVLILSLGATDWSRFDPTPAQWVILIYLGTLASGVAFFLWNLGALQVNAGTLAVFNNLKIPLAIACSLTFFGEEANLPRLIVSSVLMIAALVVAERRAT